ncbi:DUF4908 domain-containing protein [Oceanicaulis alexandrii]|uniref:DUF4908 domain-containing protein n=1 Tax=Oceanicaulis alexandrii TaxID=153233 RepID=UPI002351F8E3|nr:DUF4908 domain-containing protein [Oceanicaulis alexandrii]
MKRGIFGLLVIGAGLCALGTAEGVAQPNPFRRMLGQEVQAVERSLWFERADGRGGFIFDRSARMPLIQADSDDEVLAVHQARAAGGGEVWLTDTGRVMLRQSNLGGWTYFPSDRPDGVIVEPVGQARGFEVQPMEDSALERAATDMAQALAELSRNEVRAELTALDPEGNAYMADAMRMVRRGADLAPRRSVRDLQVVRLGVGERPRVSYDGQVLDISITPSMGYGGRPSSALIRQSLESQAR